MSNLPRVILGDFFIFRTFTGDNLVTAVKSSNENKIVPITKPLEPIKTDLSNPHQISNPNMKQTINPALKITFPQDGAALSYGDVPITWTPAPEAASYSVDIRDLDQLAWSVKGNDWQVKRTPAEITSQILKKLKQGSIILLHDSGGESGAPENSVQALTMICRRIIEECKLPITPLEFPQWTWWQRWAFVLWEKWEYLYANYFQIKRIDATSLFRLAKKRYHGPELYDEDGTLLAKKGDIVADIHLDSIRLQNKERDPQRIGLRALSLVRKSLPVLAKYIAESSEYQNVKVLVGLTLLHRGAEGLGFKVQEVPSSWAIRRIGIVQKAIMFVYHPLGKSRNNKRLGNKPKLVWISKQKLLEL